jgi:hypothetical protein
MQIGRRYQREGEGARGIARFLTDHKDCDGGFDVRRTKGGGSSNLRVICEGCGEAYEYPAAGAGGAARSEPFPSLAALREAEGERVASETPAEKPATTALPGNGNSRPSRAAAAGVVKEHRVATATLPGWLSTGLIVALIGGGLVLVGAGILGSDDEGQAPPEPTTAVSESPPEPQPPASGQTESQPVLRQRSFADRFSIGVPRGWNTGTEGAAITIAAPGSKAEMHVYFEAGARPRGDLARETSAFLSSRHPGTRPRPVPSNGPQAIFEASYSGGSEVAVTTVSGGYSYLVLKRVDRGASERIQGQADAALASFKPSR